MVIVRTIEEFNSSVASMQGVGGTIEIEDPTFSSIKLAKIICPEENPLIVSGKCVMNDVTIMDCHNIVIDGFKLTGKNAIGCSVELNDSYPDIGLKNITIKNVHISINTGGKGIFTGGHVMSGIKIIDCTILGPVLGTHGIYCSGGHWNSAYPPCSDFVVRGCTIMIQPGGRNSLQFNGRFTDIKIMDNLFAHAQLNLITLIGCQNVKVHNNLGYGANRGSFIVVYDYAGGWAQYYNYFATQQDIDDFCGTHHPCQNIEIDHNTAIVGPKRFSVDPYHSDSPTEGHPWALINNSVHSGFYFWDANVGKYVDHPGFEFPTKDIKIGYNIIASPNPNLIDTYHEHEGLQTFLENNMVFSSSPKPIFVGQSGVIGGHVGTIIKNPDFHQWPQYPFIDLVANPNYNWNEFTTSADLFSEPGYHKKVGKKFPIFQAGDNKKMMAASIEAMMELADPIEDQTR